MAIVWALALRAQPPAPPPPAPGQLIDLGGRRLHLNCAGTGSPAVIVENGGGSFSVEWVLVQPEVAKHTDLHLRSRRLRLERSRPDRRQHRGNRR